MRSPRFPSLFPGTGLLLGAALAAPMAHAEGASDGPQAKDASGGNKPAVAETVRPVGAGNDTVLADAAEFHASQGTGWEADGARWLLLEGGDAAFRLGAYGFSANRALVRITAEKKPSGTVHHLTLYLENARDLGGNSVAAEAPRLVVTAATTGTVRVGAPLLAKAQAAPADGPGDDFIAKGLRRLSGKAAAPSVAPAPPAPSPAATTGETQPPAGGRRTKVSGRDQRRQDLEKSRAEAMRAPDAPAKRPSVDEAAAPEAAPALPGLPGGTDGKPSGPFNNSQDRAVFMKGKDGKEDAVLLMGHVRLSWETSDPHAGRVMVEAQAENVVIFLTTSGGESFDGSDASKIAGIYLEDNAVIGDGNHTVRAPRIYFDVARRRATLLDAVMYAMDTQLQVPLYLRAKLLRENAGDAFEARGAVLANNGFAEPSIDLGVRKLTLTRRPADPADPQSKERNLVSASGITPDVEGVPVLWLPYAALPGWRIPLRTAMAGYSSGEGGPEVRSTWGVYELLDTTRPPGEDITANLDWRGAHGGGLGGDYKYKRDDSFGEWRGYTLPDDKGTDRIAGRDNIVHDDDHRYFMRGDHRQFFTPETTLTLHAAKESDPTIQETFFDDGYIARPPETGAALAHTHEDWAVSATGSFQLDRFTPSLADLQSRGFETERTEGEFRRIATSVFGDKANWYSENRLGRVRAAVGRDAPATRGIADWASLPEFGISSTMPFSQAAQVRGVPTSWVNRLDSRQELDVPLQSGPVDVTPYAVVRYTQWSGNIEQPGGAEDSKRLYGGGGVRFATEFAGAAVPWKSEWLNVDGLRHILRPEVDVGWLGSSMENGTLPMYDPDVEGLGEGGFARFGLVSTLQTHRGEDGNRHLVDWIRFKQDVVLRTGEDDPHRAIPRFVDWRPEYSIGGSHTHSELLWQATNALAVNAEAIYAFDTSHVEQWSTGLSYTHSDRLTSHLAYRETRMYEEQLVNYGFNYRLTPKYDLAIDQSYDFGPAKTGWLNGSLSRKIPGGVLRFIGSYDELNGSYAVGIAFSPQGFGNSNSNGLSQTLYQRRPN